MNITELKEDFETYGLPTTDKRVLEKCVKLCEEYSLSAEQLAIHWLNFATIYEHIDITIESLVTFEKEELARCKTKSTADPPSYIYVPTTGQDEELLAAYGASPAQNPNKVKSLAKTPVQLKSKKNISRCSEGPKDFLLNSPVASTPSEKYSKRNNAGTVVCSIGSCNKLQNGNTFMPQVTISGFSGSPLSSAYEYMFEKLRLNAFALEDSMGDIADMMKESMNIEDWSPVDITSNEELWFMGRVCCDSCGRLNAASVLLEGSREVSEGSVVKLDLSILSNYSIFPGQIIGVRGVNCTGDCIIAKEIITGVCLPASKCSVSLKHDVNIKIACGPFTTTDNLLFEPLSDFLKQVVASPPQILILIGPLVSSLHPLLLDDNLNETLDSVASYCINMIAGQLQDTEIQTFVVSSSRDVDCPAVYPTPPRSFGTDFKNITSLPDPSILVIEGITIGITATDAIMDLSREEISFPPQSFDRLARLSQHLVQQQTFYPLYPPPEDLAVCLQQWESYARFTFTPNVVIIPSDMRYFVKELDNCLAVNPERLAKGHVGGCYANVILCSGNAERPVINAEIIKI